MQIADEPEPEASESTVTSLKPTFELNKRAYKIFSMLFHISSANEHPTGEISWTEFLYAMQAVGFAPEKLYGSSWQFSPVEIEGVEQPIQFHEPHPHPKMRFWEARRIGRRLTRTYGWGGEMFVCK